MEKIWLKSYPPGVPSEIDATQYRSLVHLLEESFQKYASRNAFVCMDKFLTYAELDEHSKRLGAWLQSRGMKKGARVAVMMPNVLQYPIAIAAILRAGYTVVNVNPLYTPRELEHQLNDSGAEAIIILENFATTLEQVLPRTQVKHIIVANMGEMLGGLKGMIVNFVVRNVKKLVPPFSLPNAVRFKDALGHARSMKLTPVELRHEDVAFLQYTGGTTGVSKGATLTHRNIIANLLQMQAWSAPKLADLPPEERTIICALPLYHIFALTVCAMWGMREGGLNVLIPNHAVQRAAEPSGLRQAGLLRPEGRQRRRHGGAEGRGRPLAGRNRRHHCRRLRLVRDRPGGDGQPLRQHRVLRHDRHADSFHRRGDPGRRRQ
jgi:long-chain acyl-CoA synthetase